MDNSNQKNLTSGYQAKEHWQFDEGNRKAFDFGGSSRFSYDLLLNKFPSINVYNETQNGTSPFRLGNKSSYVVCIQSRFLLLYSNK